MITENQHFNRNILDRILLNFYQNITMIIENWIHLTIFLVKWVLIASYNLFFVDPLILPFSKTTNIDFDHCVFFPLQLTKEFTNSFTNR